MKKLFFLFVAGIMLPTIHAGCGGGGGNDSLPDDGADPNGGVIPQCSEGPLFTVLPLAEENFTDLAPLGNLNPTGHTLPTMHHYFYIANSDGIGAPDQVPVYMPGDAWITSINSSEHLSEDPVYVDYGIDFEPCSQYRAYFGHVQILSVDLQAQLAGMTEVSCETYTTGGKDYRNCWYAMEYFVAAGTEIGVAGGTEGQWALDFGARDMRQTPLQWANQARWENGSGDAMYTACVSEAYTSTMKTVLEARFGYAGVLRTMPPVCGTIEQDIPGTAQGAWFLAGAAPNAVFPEDPHLAMVHDNFNPGLGVLSMGTSIPEASGKHTFTPESSGVINREFNTITPNSEIYCYPITPGVILLQMIDTVTVQLEYQSAIDCSDGGYAFTGSQVTFVR